MAIEVRSGLRATAARMSPGHRRWRSFLSSLPLDPDLLVPPIHLPTERDVVICGCPRTGTSLLAAALFQPPAAVTVMEPWDGMRLPPDELFRSLRAEIEGTHQLTRGRLDLETLRRHGSVRWRPEGQAVRVGPLDRDFLLAVKWPGYWRYLPLLPQTRFLICLRNPLEVIASFKAAGGRVAQGLQYQTAFNAVMNRELKTSTRSVAERRVLLFDYVHERILPHLDDRRVFPVRYERWFDDRDALLRDLSDFLDCPVLDPTVVIHRSNTAHRLDVAERRMIAERCRTAGELGYQLDEAL